MYEDRFLITFLIDKSNSMLGNRIDYLSNGLSIFKKALLNTTIPCQNIDISIVSYSSSVEIVQRNVSICNLPDINIECSGVTAMREALEVGIMLTDEWRKRQRSIALTYKTPLIVLFTDGSPTDDFNDNVVANTIELQKKKNFILMSVGVGGGHDEEILKSIVMYPQNYVDLSNEELLIPFFSDLAESVKNLYNNISY